MHEKHAGSVHKSKTSKNDLKYDCRSAKAEGVLVNDSNFIFMTLMNFLLVNSGLVYYFTNVIQDEWHPINLRYTFICQRDPIISCSSCHL